MKAMIIKGLSYAAGIGFLIYAVQNVEQVLAIATSIVMFFVGIFEKVGDALAEFADSAEAATAIRLLLAVIGG